MGQRTQIILRKEATDGRVRTEVYHCQWGGCGVVMPFSVLSAMMTEHCSLRRETGADFLDTFAPACDACVDITDEVERELGPRVLEGVDPADIADVSLVLGACDNDDGAWALTAVEPADAHGTPAYRLGLVLTDPTRFVTFGEWWDAVAMRKFDDGGDHGRTVGRDAGIAVETLLDMFGVDVVK